MTLMGPSNLIVKKLKNCLQDYKLFHIDNSELLRLKGNTSIKMHIVLFAFLSA